MLLDVCVCLYHFCVYVIDAFGKCRTCATCIPYYVTLFSVDLFFTEPLFSFILYTIHGIIINSIIIEYRFESIFIDDFVAIDSVIFFYYLIITKYSEIWLFGIHVHMSSIPICLYQQINVLRYNEKKNCELFLLLISPPCLSFKWP